mmetsp:Transcript_10555/g.29829  ORF Transcript_10555/g.29829 Transcript_10555/m.29829 type:complete len:226 (+) Transcript_10555:446-1123(+)
MHLLHACYPWVVLHRHFLRVTVVGLVPLEDPTGKRGDQVGPGLGRSNGLGEPKNQGDVRLESSGLELARGLDALPGSRQFNQHPARRDALVAVHAQYPARLCVHSHRIKGVLDVHFRGDVPWNNARDRSTQVDSQPIHCKAEPPAVRVVGIPTLLHRVPHRLIHHLLVQRVATLTSLRHEQRVRRGIRDQSCVHHPPHRLEIPRIDRKSRHPRQLLEACPRAGRR